MKYPKGIRRLKDEDKAEIILEGWVEAKPDSEGVWQIALPDRRKPKGVRQKENQKGA